MGDKPCAKCEELQREVVDLLGEVDQLQDHVRFLERDLEDAESGDAKDLYDILKYECFMENKDKFTPTELEYILG